MGDRNAPGAVQVITEPDYEAMIIGAHPDDDDFGAGATSALWAKQGKKVVWVVMTNGVEGGEAPDMDDEEFMLTREQEQRAAAEVYGVKAVEFLRFPDGHLTNNEETRKAIVRLIRKYRPRVVLTHDPSTFLMAPDPNEEPEATGHINHPDHRATGSIVLDAIFPYVGNPRSYRDLIAQGYMPYRVHELYLFYTERSNTYVDVTETIDIKAQGLKCHVTQFGPDVDFSSSLRERAAKTAKEAKEKLNLDMQFAEAFRRVKLHIPPTPADEAPTEVAE
ncbi:PIG-L deacetylase family protein [Ktedonospora formicarum]|uniref:GlcNAc-PI de-N-acetylase n=1 Tax=Ktedonospora formicarum TaxID=2778364 RepID=A0A8J3MS73_9CHLR|nr:PIG-L deacetylase family protein [Ktedonospora formicarum]GHO43040.1 GlcNAc-PI de-N-acetylase [Ktedonospora formicarum]